MRQSITKQQRRAIFNYLRDDFNLSFSELRQVWRLKDFIPAFTLSRYPDYLIDFRGVK